MTGAELAANTAQLALAYSRTRPDGTAWLVSWRASKPAAVAELMAWELEGQSALRLEARAVVKVLDAMLALYAVHGTWTPTGIAQDAAGRQVAASSPLAVSWSLEGALEKAIGDFEGPDVEWAECKRRQALLYQVSEACGVDLAALNDTIRHQGAVMSVLRFGRNHVLTWKRNRLAS